MLSLRTAHQPKLSDWSEYSYCTSRDRPLHYTAMKLTGKQQQQPLLLYLPLVQIEIILVILILSLWHSDISRLHHDGKQLAEPLALVEHNLTDWLLGPDALRFRSIGPAIASAPGHESAVVVRNLSRHIDVADDDEA